MFNGSAHFAHSTIERGVINLKCCTRGDDERFDLYRQIGRRRAWATRRFASLYERGENLEQFRFELPKKLAMDTERGVGLPISPAFNETLHGVQLLDGLHNGSHRSGEMHARLKYAGQAEIPGTILNVGAPHALAGKHVSRSARRCNGFVC